jgi:dCMP deaminase
MSRPSKDQYYLNIAREVATRSTCLRSKYGSIVVNKANQVVSSGYNGSPRGVVNCCDSGICRRDETGTSRYDCCAAVHSEPNALLIPSSRDLEGATMYIARHQSSNPSISEVAPCKNCRRLIINSLISKVVCLQDNGDVLYFNPQEWIKDL